MNGEVEVGKCDVCGKEAVLQRTYFRYPVKCECHSPEHVELVRHCRDCVPKEPTYTRITVRTADLKRSTGPLPTIDPGAIDADIKYHELLIHNTEKRGGHPSIHEKSTLQALIYLKGMMGREKAQSMADT